MNRVNAKRLHTFLLNHKKDSNTKKIQNEAINDTNLILISLGFKNENKSHRKIIPNCILS